MAALEKSNDQLRFVLGAVLTGLGGASATLHLENWWPEAKEFADQYHGCSPVAESGQCDT